jgi:hypothetical protein
MSRTAEEHDTWCRTCAIRNCAVRWLDTYGDKIEADQQISVEQQRGILREFELRSWRLNWGSSASLDIWSNGCRLFSATWNVILDVGFDDGLEVVLFERGAWERHFLDIVLAQQEVISLVNFADTFGSKINSLNSLTALPATARIVANRLWEIHDAAVAGRAHDVARISRGVEKTIEQELRLNKECRRSTRRVRLRGLHVKA